MRPRLQREPTTIDVLVLLRRSWRRWLGTTILVSGLVAAYAIGRPPTWEATQAIVIRNDALPRLNAPGKFRLEDEMKTVQETVLEVARSAPVLSAALARVGPPADQPASGQWPPADAVESLESEVSLSPPKGSEFGTTEIFYLRVKDRQQDRAVRLVSAVFDELQGAYGRLRASVARSMEAELQRSVRLAQEDLSRATRDMARMEQQAGGDLIALRMLQQSPSGESDLFRTLTSSLDDLRQARAAERTNSALLDLVQGARQAPQILLAAPRELLELHPALARLSQGLSEARLRTATLSGKLQGAHPMLTAARQEEEAIRQDIFRELDATLEGVAAAARLAAARRETMESQVAELRERVDRLTSLRADYSNLEQEVQQRRALLEEAQRSLSEVQVIQATAASSSLLSPAEPPDGGTGPAGPRRATLILFGIAGGLAAGFGLVFLTVPIGRLPDGSTSEPVFSEIFLPDRHAASRVHRTDSMASGPHANSLPLAAARHWD